MRRTIVFLSLLGMLGVVATIGAMRERPELFEPAIADADGSADSSDADGDGDADGSAAKESGVVPLSAEGVAGASGGEAADGGDGAADGTSEEANKNKEPETLRVVSLGWEVLAPGVLANEGLSAGETSKFKERGLDVTFASVSEPEQIEVRLGRGGQDERGADVALMPLPAFVASYERLRALSPQVFFVVAWSRGRDAMVGDAQMLLKPPRGEVRVGGASGSSETLLALFVLDQAGVSPERVRLEEAGKSKSRRVLQAVQRRRSRELDARKLVMSTADATHLVPVVAVAPAGVVKRRRDALVRWSQTWMDGARGLSGDPAEAARQLAAQKGAPEAVDLIDALGWLEFTDLQGAAEAAGLSGRSAVNLDALFHRSWDLWRDVGLLTTPPPERVPLNATVIADLAHEATPKAAPTKPRRSGTQGEAETLLVRSMPGRRLNAEAEAVLVGDVGFLAGVFSRSTIEVWVPRSPDAGQRVAHHAADRFGLPEGRVVVRKDRETKTGNAAVITVHAAQ